MKLKKEAIIGDVEYIYKLVEKIRVNINKLEQDLMYYSKNK